MVDDDAAVFVVVVERLISRDFVDKIQIVQPVFCLVGHFSYTKKTLTALFSFSSIEIATGLSSLLIHNLSVGRC